MELMRSNLFDLGLSDFNKLIAVKYQIVRISYGFRSLLAG